MCKLTFSSVSKTKGKEQQCAKHYNMLSVSRGLGRIWETGCVKKPVCVKKPTGCVNFVCIFFFIFIFPPFFFCWPCIFETGRDYHGQHGWLPKPLSVRHVSAHGIFAATQYGTKICCNSFFSHMLHGERFIPNFPS